MRVYFNFFEENGVRGLEAIALDPHILIESFGENIVIYYYDWDTEEEFFSPMIEEHEEPWEYYNVLSGIITKYENIDAYFNSWREFYEARDKYEKETGEELDWYVEWTEEYKEGVMIHSTRPDIETLVKVLKSYLQ